MFVQFTLADGNEIIVNASRILSVVETPVGLRLTMSNGGFISVQGTLEKALTRLNDIRLS